MEEILEKDFFPGLWEKTVTWITNHGIFIVLLLALLAVTVKAFGFIALRFKKVYLNRHAYLPTIERMGVEQRVETLYGIVIQTGKMAIYIIFILTLLTQIGIDIAPILASVGIVGLALGFGSQELVRDVVSGFFNLFENNIRVGDVVTVNGTSGAVEKVELRTTVLRDFSGVVHVFQNGKIDTLANLTKDWSAMVFNIGVAYKENLDKVMEVMRSVGEELQHDDEFKDKILEPLEIFGLNEFGDSALVVLARFKTEPLQQWTVGRMFRKRLKEAFDQEGIEIPFPHRTLYWGEGTDETKVKTGR